MGRHVLQVQGYTSDEIRRLFRKDERYTIGIRLYAVYQVSLGRPSRELEVLYNTSFKQVTNWVHRFEKEGINGLADKLGRGRTPKLSEEQYQTLRQVILTATPEKYGYNTVTWTGPLLIEFVKKEFGITYKKAQIYNIIKSLGLTYQKGRGIYPESDPVAQEVFTQTLKKTIRS
jgi:transposase